MVMFSKRGKVFSASSLIVGTALAIVDGMAARDTVARGTAGSKTMLCFEVRSQALQFVTSERYWKAR
jgi:hypothetical protein